MIADVVVMATHRCWSVWPLHGRTQGLVGVVYRTRSTDPLDRLRHTNRAVRVHRVSGCLRLGVREERLFLAT